MAKRKRTNNDLQNTTQKSKDRATRTPLKTGGFESTWWRLFQKRVVAPNLISTFLLVLRRVSSSCYTSGTRRVTVLL